MAKKGQTKKNAKKATVAKREYDASPARKKARAARNKARRQAEREGKVSKGDGKHVDHKKPLSQGGSTDKSNTRVISAKKNVKDGGKIGGKRSKGPRKKK
jgi:hypothetical protein